MSLGLSTPLGFFAILHSWFNAFAEMMTFADRMFYKVCILLDKIFLKCFQKTLIHISGYRENIYHMHVTHEKNFTLMKSLSTFNVLMDK